jgi:hypothetical protein
VRASTPTVGDGYTRASAPPCLQAEIRPPAAGGSVLDDIGATRGRCCLASTAPWRGRGGRRRRWRRLRRPRRRRENARARRGGAYTVTGRRWRPKVAPASGEPPMLAQRSWRPPRSSRIVAALRCADGGGSECASSDGGAGALALCMRASCGWRRTATVGGGTATAPGPCAPARTTVRGRGLAETASTWARRCTPSTAATADPDSARGSEHGGRGDAVARRRAANVGSREARVARAHRSAQALGRGLGHSPSGARRTSGGASVAAGRQRACRSWLALAQARAARADSRCAIPLVPRRRGTLGKGFSVADDSRSTTRGEERVAAGLLMASQARVPSVSSARCAVCRPSASRESSRRSRAREWCWQAGSRRSGRSSACVEEARPQVLRAAATAGRGSSIFAGRECMARAQAQQCRYYGLNLSDGGCNSRERAG